MQSIRDQEAEGEHILSLDLDWTAVQELQQGRGYKTWADYWLQITQDTNQGQIITPWIGMSPFD